MHGCRQRSLLVPGKDIVKILVVQERPVCIDCRHLYIGFTSELRIMHIMLNRKYSVAADTACYQITSRNTPQLFRGKLAPQLLRPQGPSWLK
jgi:hypothetical protein